MIDTSTERLMPLKELPAAAIPGREGETVKIDTLRYWCTVGVRGIRLESLKVEGKYCTSIEAWNRFFQAVTDAAAATTKRGRTPIVVGTRARRDPARALREDVARLWSGCKKRGGDGNNGEPSSSTVNRYSSMMLEAMARVLLSRWQRRVQRTLESLTRDKTLCVPNRCSLARLAAIYGRSFQDAPADLVDQLRDKKTRMKERRTNGTYNK